MKNTSELANYQIWQTPGNIGLFKRFQIERRRSLSHDGFFKKSREIEATVLKNFLDSL